MAGDFAIRNILCAVNFDPHAREEVLSHAAQLAGKFGARLALAYVTSSVETYGPGGSYVVPEFKEAVVGYASKEIAKLQQDAGTNAEVIIESGDTYQSACSMPSSKPRQTCWCSGTTLHAAIWGKMAMATRSSAMRAYRF